MNTKKIMLFVFTILMSTTIAQGMNLIKKPGKVACSVCWDDKECYVSTCHPKDKHAVCLGCRRDTVELHLSNSEEPHCPVKNCANVIAQRTIQDILRNDRALLNRYDKFAEEKWMRDNGFSPCFTPNCRGRFDNKRGQRIHQCDRCRNIYCTVCEFDHTGMTCEIAKRDRTQNGTDIGRNNQWRDMDIQKCPRCPTVLQKNKGCNHMTCGTCHHQFCWMCLADWHYKGDLRACSCPHFGPDHAELATRRAAAENLVLAAIGLGSIAYIGYTTIYQTLNQKRKLDLIAHTAEKTVEKILAIEFELFDENNSLLTLQEQFDIEAIVKTVKDEKRDALQSAIEAYDASLKSVHDTISSSKYYHQTPEYFAKNESKLVGSLYTNLDALKEIITSCKSDISVNWKKLIGMSGLLAGAVVGARLYYFDR